MLKQLQIMFFAASLAAGAVALAEQEVREVAMKDGTTLLIFKDGKMSHRDKDGRVELMKSGTTMESRDGQTIVMNGNEVWRRTAAERLREEPYRGR